MQENRFQAEVVQYLQSIGLFFFSVPNEAGGKGAMIRMARLKAMGLRSGVADLVVLIPRGKAVFLELKTDKGKQSEAQVRFQEKVESLGFSYFLCRNLKEVVDTFSIYADN
jgi:alkylation response protein AidB-like acyl-CoA dehydrogenase